MSLILDHFFVLTKVGAPEADIVSATGLAEGTSNTHPGQGTANRRFFLANSAIELLFVRDANEESAGPAAPLKFSERLRNKQASRFGLVFRTTDDGSVDALGPVWNYHADYLPPATAMRVAASSDNIAEPLIIVLPRQMPGQHRKKMRNPNSLSVLRIDVCTKDFSTALAAVSSLENLEIHTANEQLMDIELDHGVAGKTDDLRPQLPVVVRQ